MGANRGEGKSTRLSPINSMRSQKLKKIVWWGAFFSSYGGLFRGLPPPPPPPYSKISVTAYICIRALVQMTRRIYLVISLGSLSARPLTLRY